VKLRNTAERHHGAAQRSIGCLYAIDVAVTHATFQETTGVTGAMLIPQPRKRLFHAHVAVIDSLVFWRCFLLPSLWAILKGISLSKPGAGLEQELFGRQQEARTMTNTHLFDTFGRFFLRPCALSVGGLS